MKIIKKGLKIAYQFFQFALWHAPILVVSIVGLYFAIYLFVNPASKTVSITSYTFAVVAALSGVSFGYSRSLDDQEIRRRVQYCGERFLHSAILFLVASIVKYFLLQDEILFASDSIEAFGIIVFYMDFFPDFLFLGSLINCIVGLRELNSVLYDRKSGQEIRKLF